MYLKSGILGRVTSEDLTERMTLYKGVEELRDLPCCQSFSVEGGVMEK